MAQTPEQIRAKQREYYARNREKIREYRRANRKRRNERRRERYQQDSAYRSAEDAKNREYQQRNREQFRAYKREYYQRNREKALASHTLNRHGLWPEEWAAMWAAQDGQCYLCGEPMVRGGKGGAHVDHDHSHCPPNRSCRICQRGLACMDCNIAIGHARNDPARLRRMADALEAAQLLVDQRKAEADEQLTLM